MQKQKIAENVIEKIKKQEIRPKSKWFFVLKNILFWFLFFISILLGGLSFSFVLYILFLNDTLVSFYLANNKNVFIVIPYLWFFSFSFFIIFADYILKNTKKGYKYSLLNLIVITLLITLFLGFVLVIFGFTEKVDRVFLQHSYLYRKYGNAHYSQNDPAKGIFIGKFIYDQQDKNLFFKDIDNNLYEVLLRSQIDFDPMALHHFKFMYFRLFGRIIDKNKLEIFFIKPLHMMNMFDLQGNFDFDNLNFIKQIQTPMSCPFM